MPADQAAILVRPIGRQGPLVDDKQLTRDLDRLNQKMAKRMKRTFQRSTKTWSEEVKFQQLTESRPDPIVITYTTNEIYGYVSGGTRVRYAVMSPDFDPKTRPGELDARPGEGGVLFISRKHPKPGITARNFPKLVEDIHAPEYAREVNALIVAAVMRGASNG